MSDLNQKINESLVEELNSSKTDPFQKENSRGFLKARKILRYVLIILGAVVFGLMIFLLILNSIGGKYKGTSVITLSDNDEILKPMTDNNQYRVIQLTNGLKALLISDPTTHNSEIKVSINAGTLVLTERLGFSLFTSMMLFSGSSLHPDPKVFDSLLSSNLGSKEFTVNSDFTTFGYKLNKLEESRAFEMFSSYLKAPLFNVDYVKEARNQINNYYMDHMEGSFKNLKDVLIKEISNHLHPFATHNYGKFNDYYNVKHEMLQEFYEAHFKPENLRIVIKSNHLNQAIKE